MSYRTSSLEALVVLLAIVLPLGVRMTSQTKPIAEKGSAAARVVTSWVPTRTAWGEPDLQGIWNNGTVTPLERPDAFQGRELLTDEEKAVLDRAADTTDSPRPTNAVADVEQAYNAVWWDRGKSIGRTSLITDPQDGRRLHEGR